MSDEKTAGFALGKESSKDPDISELLPNFKLGEAAPAGLTSSIFQAQNNILILEDIDESFVVLGKNIMESIRGSSPSEGEEMPQSEFNSNSDQQSVFTSVSQATNIEHKLHEMLEENLKLKETIDKNDNVMKNQFEKIATWQKEVMTVCDDHRQRYIETKELINRLKIENEFLRKSIKKQNQLQNSTKTQSTTISQTETASEVPDSPLLSIDEGVSELERSAVPSLSPTMINSTTSVLSQASSMGSNTTIRSSKTQTPSIVTQCVSTETESAVSCVETQTPVKVTQCASTETESEHVKPREKRSAKVVCDQSVAIQTPTEVTQYLSTVIQSNVEDTAVNCPESLANLSKRVSELQAYLQKTNKEIDMNPKELEKSITSTGRSKVDNKDVEIMYLLEINKSLKQQIEALEKNTLPEVEMRMDKSLENGTDSVVLKENVDAYNQKLRDLTNCFVSTFSRYIEGQNILKECAKIIQVIEDGESNTNKNLSEGDLKIYRQKLCDYRKKLMDEQVQIIDNKQTIIKAQKQFQKILSDYNSLIYELALLRQENQKIKASVSRTEEENGKKFAEVEKSLDEREKKLNEERATFIHQQQSLNDERALVRVKLEDIMTEIQALAEEKQKLVDERKSLHELRALVDRQKELHEVEKSILEREVSLLRENCNGLMKKLEDIKAESEAVSSEKENLSHERANLDELRVLLDDEIKSHRMQQESLIRENKMLKNKCDIIQMDLDNFNTELVSAHKFISELRKKNNELREAAETVSAYRIQSEEHEKDILQMFDLEKNYLDQIQKLSDENRELRDENTRIRNENQQ